MLVLMLVLMVLVHARGRLAGEVVMLVLASTEAAATAAASPSLGGAFKATADVRRGAAV